MKRRALVAAALSMSCVAPLVARAQVQAQAQRWQEATAGSELEDYLRVLSVAGIARPALVGIRAWSPLEIRAIAGCHPEAQPKDVVILSGAKDPAPARNGQILRFAQDDKECARGQDDNAALIRPDLRTVYNSAFPLGFNDGAVWAGRGFTQSLSGGMLGVFGPLTIQLDPVAFWAQNASVALAPNGRTGDARFGDVTPGIDRPQRFGDANYARVDPGQSTIRVDKFGATLGVSTANEVWGPGVTNALVMSANAAGIPRVFFGTSAPANIWIGRLHARVMLGRMTSTPYAPAAADSGKREALGLVATFSPRFAPNLEIGGTRFYQEAWPSGGASPGDLSILFEGFLRGQHYDERSARAQDQVASAFFRWALPPVAEVYGEIYREDHSVDLRDLAVEPEHDLGYMLGMRRVWKDADAARLTALRVEVVNGRPSHLQAVRPQTHMYTHGQLTAGHTQLGQVLGSEALFGGGGGVLAVDRYTPAGRWTVSYQRFGRDWRTVGGTDESFVRRGQDIINSLGVDATRNRGKFEWHGGIAALLDLNRDFARDVFGVQLSAGVKWRP